MADAEAEKNALPGPKQHWEMIRRAIEHEDNLTNHRVTWLLTAQGFLLAGFVLAQNAIVDHKTPAIQRKYELVITVIFFGAIWLCMIVGTALAMASEHITGLCRWWMETYQGEKRSETDLPALCGVQPSADLRGLNWLTVKLKRFIFWSIWWSLSNPLFKYELPQKGIHTGSSPNATTAPEVAWKCDPTSQPPICGEFTVPRILRIRCIPAIFVVINAVLGLCCLLSAISYGWGGSPAKPSWFVDSVKYSKDAVGKATVEILVKVDDAAHEGEVDSQQLYRRLLSALQSNPNARSSPWRAGTIKASTDEPGRRAIEFTITWDDRDGSATVDLGKLLDEVRQAIATNPPTVTQTPASGTLPAANHAIPAPSVSRSPAAQQATNPPTVTQKKSP